jgi:hypothetical protein
MSKTNFKIWESQKLTELNLAPLDTSVIDDKYFIIDIWETSDNKPRQVIFRLNDVDVLNIDNDVISFKVTTELSNIIHNLESQKIIKLCVPYVKKLKLTGIKYNSLVSENDVGGKSELVMKFKLNNQDYDPVFYSDGKKTDLKCFYESHCRIIIELVGVQFDLSSKTILPDFRLRQVAKNAKVPKRFVLSEYSLADDSDEVKDSDDDNPPDLHTKDVYIKGRNIEVSEEESSDKDSYDKENEDNDLFDNENASDESDTSDDNLINMKAHLFNVISSVK